MKDPLVSVVLGSYQGEKYIAAQIESILGQTVRDLELIVSDDASKDRTAEIVRSFARSDARVRLITHDTNRGITQNFLDALAQCSGEYTAYSDQDDLWKPHKLERLAALLKKNPRRTLVYSDLAVSDDSLKTVHKSFFASTGEKPRAGDLSGVALLKNIPPGCSMLFGRPVRDRVGEIWSNAAFRAENLSSVLDETPFMHDYLVFVVSALMGEIAYLDDRLVFYRQHASNNIGAFYRAQGGRARFIVLLKKKLRMLDQAAPGLVGNSRDIEDFARVYSGDGKFGERRLHLNKFIFLRKNTAKDRSLGCLECFFPKMYDRLKERAKP